MKINTEWIYALKTMGKKKYWNRPNTVEFFAFIVKAMIIIPGLRPVRNGCLYKHATGKLSFSI